MQLNSTIIYFFFLYQVATKNARKVRPLLLSRIHIEPSRHRSAAATPATSSLISWETIFSLFYSPKENLLRRFSFFHILCPVSKLQANARHFDKWPLQSANDSMHSVVAALSCTSDYFVYDTASTYTSTHTHSVCFKNTKNKEKNRQQKTKQTINKNWFDGSWGLGWGLVIFKIYRCTNWAKQLEEIKINISKCTLGEVNFHPHYSFGFFSHKLASCGLRPHWVPLGVFPVTLRSS